MDNESPYCMSRVNENDLSQKLYSSNWTKHSFNEKQRTSSRVLPETDN